MSSHSNTNSNTSELYCCKYSNVYGRYLEANKLIKKGTLLIADDVLVAGPLRTSNLVCVGCHVELSSKSNEDNNAYLRCSKCSWPICSEKCSDSKYHRSECEFFAQHKIQPPDDLEACTTGEFGALAVLRALLLKLTEPGKWEQFNKLEHHNDIREKLPLWKENEEQVVHVIQNKWKLGHIFNSKHEIHTVCGILEVNAFELGDMHYFRGLFPHTSMIAHNCVPNVTQFLHSTEGKIDIRTTVDIQPGTPLFLTYALSLHETFLRHQSLLDAKFFDCACERRSDPTELETHLGTSKCQKCKQGLILREKCSNNFNHTWLCNNGKCRTVVSQSTVDRLIQTFYQRWEQLHDIKSLEKFLIDCDVYFHSNHFIPFRVKFDLCQAYGREAVSSIHGLSQTDLERKATLCRQVLEVLDKILPGFNVTRAWILYELQAAELVLSKLIFEYGSFDRAELKTKLTSAMKMLVEAIKIFEFCDRSSSEHKIAKVAKQDTLIGLQNWIDCL